jgi:hypothetical protein
MLKSNSGVNSMFARGRNMTAVDKEIIDLKRAERKQKEAIQQSYEENFNKWRDYDLLTCLISIIGLMLAIATYEYSTKKSR